MKRVKTRYVTKLYQYQDFLGHDDLERAMELTLHTNANKGLCYVIEEDGKIECIVHRGRVFRESPWTYIVTDPDGRPVAETLPENTLPVDLSIYSYGVEEDGEPFEFKNVIEAQYMHDIGVWISGYDKVEMKGRRGRHDFVQTVIAYAWKERPDPAPLPEGVG